VEFLVRSSSCSTSSGGVSPSAYPSPLDFSPLDLSPLTATTGARGGRSVAFAQDFCETRQIPRAQSVIGMTTTGPHHSALPQPVTPIPCGLAGALPLDGDIPEAHGDNLIDWGRPPDLGPPPAPPGARVFRLDEALRQPVPNVISYIWVGANRISTANYNNMLHTARLNPGATLHIYIDSAEKDIGLEALATRSGFDAGCLLRQCPNVTLIRPRNSAFGAEFSKAHGDAYALYERCMATGRFAIASDALRYPAVYRHGGVYFDADDEVLTPIDFQRLNAAPDEVLHQMPYDLAKHHGGGKFFPSCPFAAHAGNALLLEVIDRSGANYRRHVRLEQGDYKPSYSFEGSMPYYEIHRLCGPGVFTDVLVEHDPRSAAILDLHERQHTSSGDLAPGIEAHVPFAAHHIRACDVRSGSDHSWDTSKPVSPLEHFAVEEPEGLPQPNVDGIRLDEHGNAFVRAGAFTLRVVPSGVAGRHCVLASDGRIAPVTVKRNESGTWSAQNIGREPAPPMTP